MNILASLVLCAALAPQDSWKDTHRIHLRNGNALDGRLEKVGEKEILVRWTPGVLLWIKTMDVVKIEEITIRTINSEPRKVPLHEAPPGKEAPAPADEGPPPRDPKRPQSDIDKFFTRILAADNMTSEILAKEVRGLGLEGAKAIIAELPLMDQPKTDLALVALDQMRDLPIDRELRGLLESKRSDIRAGICKILGNRGSGSLGSIAGLLRDPAPKVRIAALMALGNSGDSSMLNAISDLALDPDPMVRSRAIRAAEEMSARIQGDTDLALRWLSQLTRGPAGSVAEIAGGIARLAERAVEGFPTDDVRHRFAELLTDREPSTRAAAAFALSSVRPAEASAESIINALSGERDPRAAVSMCEALGKLKVHKSIETLIDRLREDSKDVRPAAQRALEKIAGNAEFGGDYEKWNQWFEQNKGRNP